MQIAVIDTETNWKDEVMSLGLVIADENLSPKAKYYFIIDPEYKVGGMFSKTLTNVQDATVSRHLDSRQNVIAFVRELFQRLNVTAIFAYNARFDLAHLSELADFKWYDIMQIAAYRRYNKYISEEAECHFNSGRLKRGYGVQPIYQMVTGDTKYKEKHNGYHDAEDELMIMQKLELPLEIYAKSKIN